MTSRIREHHTAEFNGVSGGQGDCVGYKNCCHVGEMPNDAWIAACKVSRGASASSRHEKERRLPASAKDRFRGVRIFDISDIKNQASAAVQTCADRHTHTWC